MNYTSISKPLISFAVVSLIILLITGCRPVPQVTDDAFIRPLVSCPDYFTYNIGTVTRKVSKKSTSELEKRVIKSLDDIEEQIKTGDFLATNVIGKNLLEELRVSSNLSIEFYETWNRNVLVMCRLEDLLENGIQNEETKNVAIQILLEIFSEFAEKDISADSDEGKKLANKETELTSKTMNSTEVNRYLKLIVEELAEGWIDTYQCHWTLLGLGIMNNICGGPCTAEELGLVYIKKFSDYSFEERGVICSEVSNYFALLSQNSITIECDQNIWDLVNQSKNLLDLLFNTNQQVAFIKDILFNRIPLEDQRRLIENMISGWTFDGYSDAFIEAEKNWRLLKSFCVKKNCELSLLDPSLTGDSEWKSIQYFTLVHWLKFFSIRKGVKIEPGCQIYLCRNEVSWITENFNIGGCYTFGEAGDNSLAANIFAEDLLSTN